MASPNDKVNPENGLLLSALHDRAFDRGLITLDDDMSLLVSRNHEWIDDGYFSESIERYHGQGIRLPKKFRPEREFLAYHREHVFVG